MTAGSPSAATTLLEMGLPPERLVEGDPDQVRVLASNLRLFANVLDHAVQGMSGVTTTQWQGPRAQAWRTIHEAQPGKWSEAAAGFRSAALAMTRHASSIDEARTIAAKASSLWNEGEQAEQKQNAAEATDPTLMLVHQYQGSTDAAGTGLKARAVSTLVEAMDLVDTSGRTSAGLMRSATQAAPTSQESTFELFHDLGKGYDGVTFHDVTTRARDELGVGMVGGLVRLGELVWRTTQHQAPADRLKQTGLESYYRWTGKMLGVDGSEGVTKAGEFISPMLIPIPAAGLGVDAAALGARGSQMSARVLAQFRRAEMPEFYKAGSLADGALRPARFWPPERYRITEFRGLRVYQRDDLIDPLRRNREGRTNLDLMKDGLSPIGADGRRIQIHHLTQRDGGAMVEIQGSLHNGKGTSKTLHINQPPKDYPSGINRPKHDYWRGKYWEHRYEQMTGGTHE